jgi:hypothetical protein
MRHRMPVHRQLCQSCFDVRLEDSRARSSQNSAFNRNTSDRSAIGALFGICWWSTMSDVLCSERTNPLLKIVFRLKSSYTENLGHPAVYAGKIGSVPPSAPRYFP